MTLHFVSDMTTLDQSESTNRRLLELRLMHNFTEYMTRPFPDHLKAHVVTGWGVEVPRMSFQHENLMCMLMASSASHLLRANPEDPELVAAAEVYLALALQKQHKAVATLNMHDADAVCFTGMLLLINSLARMAWRPLEPYSPPLEWLQMGIGFRSVLNLAKESYMQGGSAKVVMLLKSEPEFDEKFLFRKDNLAPFLSLLGSETQPGDDLADADTREAYEQALCYIGYLYQSVNENEPIYVVGRKIIAFAIFVPKRFVQFVGEKRPRALVILAHLFALMSRTQSIWWVGKTPLREIKGIMGMLPQGWQAHMRWPLTMTGLILQEG